MTIRPLWLGLVALASGFAPLNAQPGDPLELDLATPTLNRTVDPGTYRIVIKNRLPAQDYTLQVLREAIPVPAIEKFAHEGTGYRNASCDGPVKKLLEALDTTTFETALRRRFADWAGPQSPMCRAEGLEAFRQATTLEPGGAYSLAEQQRLRITVTRRNASQAATTWEFVVATDTRGDWRTIYGFTFVPDRDQRFYARQLDGTPTKFAITRERDNADGLSMEFLPSLLFVWSPTRYRNSDWSPGFTGGLGYNFDHLAVLLGGSLTYNENLTVTVGAAVHQQQRLIGQYRPGDTVATALTSTQLHVERYLPNVYFGIALRLGDNPFARKTEPQREEAGVKPAETPANAAPKPGPDPARPATPAPTAPAGPTFNVDSLPENDTVTIADRKATVVTGADSVIVTFGSVNFAEINGSYVRADTAEGGRGPCLTLHDSAREALPAPIGFEIQQVCFAANAAQKFGDANAGDPLVATLGNLRIAIPKQNHRGTVYTATLVDVKGP